MADEVFDVTITKNASIPFTRSYVEVKIPLNGLGYFGGTFPDGLTTIAGKPISATIRVVLRTPINGYGDGVLVATTQSNPDGTWRINGIPTHLKYDVIARYDGENDVIMSNVSPALM